MRDRFYSTADLARVCGVSISTIKRWTDAGLLRCVRTPGGHRKYRVQDVAEAARRLGLCSVDPAEPAAARVDELALLLLQGNRDALAARCAVALDAGDTLALRGLLMDLHRHGLRLVDVGLLLRAALRRLEADTPASDRDVFVRRRAVQVALATSRHLLEQAPPVRPDAPLALVAAAPGTHDELTTGLVLLALSECGWRAIDVGTASAPEVVRGGLRAERTDMLVLVCDNTDSAPMEPLRAEAVASGTDVVLHAACEDAAFAALTAQAAARERRFTAAMV